MIKWDKFLVHFFTQLGKKNRDSTAQQYIYFSNANKTYNFNIINLTKPGNQKGKCPSCWPPIAQMKSLT